MKKLLSVVLLVSMFSFAFSQSGNRWSDWFSYNNVLAFKESNGKIIAATENGVFYYDTISGEITKLSKGKKMLKVRGFTLSELMVTLAICAIIACLSLPYLNQLLISNEVNHMKRTLTIYIQKSKSDAQIHHKNVTLCASKDLTSCHLLSLYDWHLYLFLLYLAYYLREYLLLSDLD